MFAGPNFVFHDEPQMACCVENGSMAPEKPGSRIFLGARNGTPAMGLGKTKADSLSCTNAIIAQDAPSQ